MANPIHIDLLSLNDRLQHDVIFNNLSEAQKKDTLRKLSVKYPQSGMSEKEMLSIIT